MTCGTIGLGCVDSNGGESPGAVQSGAASGLHPISLLILLVACGVRVIATMLRLSVIEGETTVVKQHPDLRGKSLRCSLHSHN